MANWIDVGRVENFPPDTLTPCRAADQDLLIAHARGTLVALRDACPHAGKPLSDGSLCGHVLTCRHHGYAYDVRTGRNIDFPYDELPARLLPLRVRDDRVEVKIVEVRME
jgi:3-phenylpropionate/trans-cinnamate dioxygenase ferredoxin component